MDTTLGDEFWVGVYATFAGTALYDLATGGSARRSRLFLLFLAVGGGVLWWVRRRAAQARGPYQGEGADAGRR